MYSSLEKILNRYFPGAVGVSRPGSRPANYESVQWLDKKKEIAFENCIYVGKASVLPEKLPDSNIGLIIENDCGRDFSHETIEIIELKSGINSAELCLFLKDRVFRSYEISNISKTLISGFTENSSIWEMADILQEKLGNPVFINLSLLGKAVYYSNDRRMADEIKTLENLKHQPVDENKWGLFNNIASAHEATLVEDGYTFKGHRRMHCALTKGVNTEQAVGVLTVFEVCRRFSGNEKAFLQFMAYLISQKIGEPGFEQKLTIYMYEQKLQNLINGNPPEEDQAWVNALFGTSSDRFILALAETHALPSTSFEALRLKLMRSSGYGTVFMRGSYLVFITRINDETQKQIIDVIEECADEYGVVFGMSSRFENIVRLQKYYTQAKKVRAVSEKLAGNKKVMSFDELSLKMIVSQVGESERVELFCVDDLERLYRHDEQEGTEYVKTLFTYLDNGGNLEKTRTELIIHRNTLTYRLSKIERILEHTLSDGQYIVKLYYSRFARELL